VIVLVVIALASILLMGALALDGGHMLVNKTRLQNAVDAAALSGAKTLMMVSGATGAATLTQSAARATLTRNAIAAGNQELATAIGSNVDFATVELSASVYGPFTFPGPANAKYVRVTVPNYPLSEFFWGILQAVGNGISPDKAVSAIATAGPSPTSPCDVAPLLVCGDPAQYNPGAGNIWGYHFGDLELLKTGANDSSPIGPGNFQLLDFGSGGNTVRDGLAGGIEQCNNIGENVDTKPGNTVGPAVQGMNTRFGEYQGGLKAADYPPDLVITSNSPELKYDDSEAPPRIEHQNLPVTSSNGNLSTASGPLFDYNDWAQSSAACVANPGSCQGAFERRMLKIVVGECSGTDGGTASVPVLGFACFFVLQPMTQKGNESQLFGQFIKECEGDNVSGPNPWTDTGPQIIQLYKTYINGISTPSTDS
jgi:hypothetical protein